MENFKLRKRRKTVMLTLTHECNLACRYCYEANKSRQTMPLSVAQEAIERHFASSENFDELEISLHGGEPFLRYPMLRELCEWVWSRDWPRPYILFATTNGTVVHGEIQEWAAAHRHQLYLAVSLDGTPEMHDSNRSNSAARIDSEFFLRNWPDQPVKMTVSDVTLPRLAEGIIYLHQRGFKLQCNFAYGVDWSNADNLTKLAEQLDRLIPFYLEHPSIEPCDFMSMEMSAVGAQLPAGVELSGSGDEGAKRWCGIGTDLFAVDIDGTEYPCHLFLPLAAGPKATLHQQFDFAQNERLQDARCQGCALLPVCPTCYAMNTLESGDPAVRNKALCSLTKLRGRAVSKLVAQMILRRDEFPAVRELSDDAIALAIMGIEEIQATITP